MDALCRSPRLHDNDSSTVPSFAQRDDPHRSARFHSAAFLEDGDDVRLESRNSPIDPSFQRFFPIFPSMSRVARVVLPSTRGRGKSFSSQTGGYVGNSGNSVRMDRSFRVMELFFSIPYRLRRVAPASSFDLERLLLFEGWMYTIRILKIPSSSFRLIFLSN